MKALKTKTLKIGEVLQSISRLFSGPERRPLLERYVNCNRSSVLLWLWSIVPVSIHQLTVSLLRNLYLSLRLVTIRISFLPCIIVLHWANSLYLLLLHGQSHKGIIYAKCEVSRRVFVLALHWDFHWNFRVWLKFLVLNHLNLSHLMLNRFKDYIPAKYHSLYEQYVEGKVD
jgi:hypothetical protein